MPLSLDDMLPSERRLLAKLGGHVAPDVAIGCELGELNADELLTSLTMRLRGLVEIVDGWRGSRWLMLTGAARRMIADGFGECGEDAVRDGRSGASTDVPRTFGRRKPTRRH